MILVTHKVPELPGSGALGLARARLTRLTRHLSMPNLVWVDAAERERRSNETAQRYARLMAQLPRNSADGYMPVARMRAACSARTRSNMTAESWPRPTRKPTGTGRIARESAACSACHSAGCSEVTSFLWLFRGYLVSREDDEDVKPTSSRMRPTRNVKMS